MAKNFIEIIFFSFLATQAVAAETWVNVGSDEQVLIDTSSIGRLNDGRIIFWEMSRINPPAYGVTWVRYLIVGRCGASTIDIEAQRGYDADQSYVDSDAKSRVLKLGDSSLMAAALRWACGHVTAEPEGQ